MSRTRNFFLAIAGGLLLSAAFPDVGWWWLAPIAMAILFVAISESTARGAFGLGFMFCMAFSLVHISWTNFAVGWIPWLALCAAWSAYVGLACAIFAHANWAGWFDNRFEFGLGHRNSSTRRKADQFEAR